MNRQAGQSMTEFAVGMVAMALMLLGSVTIAAYQQTQRRAAIAARQASFEGAWIGGRQDIAAAARRAAELRLQDPSVVDAFAERYIDPADVSAEASIGPAPARAQSAGMAMVEPLRVAGGFLGRDFDLATDGLLAGTIDVAIQPNPALPRPFSGMSVELQQPFALMTDAWNASASSQVRSRTSGLVPTSTLSGLQALWRPLLAPLSLLEPSLSRLCLGIIEPDRVPEDRLGAGRSALPGRCP